MQLSPGYSFYIGYFFNGNLTNYHRLLQTGQLQFGLNLQTLYYESSFSMQNFLIEANESVQFAVFYSQNNVNLTANNNTGTIKYNDLTEIWQSIPITFKITNNIYPSVVPFNSNASQTDYKKLNQSVYVVPENYQDYVLRLDANSSINWLDQTYENKVMPFTSGNPLIYETYGSVSQSLGYDSVQDSVGNTNIEFNNSYGIIGEFIEVATFQNPIWSIAASWFPNDYCLYTTWMDDGQYAYPSQYSAWKSSTYYKDYGKASYGTSQNFLPGSIPYPVVNNYAATLGGTYNGQSEIGLYFNAKGDPVTANGTVLTNWGWWSSNAGEVLSSNTFTLNSGLGAYFKYSVNKQNELTSQITFNTNAPVANYMVGCGNSDSSNYSLTPYAPLQFGMSNLVESVAQSLEQDSSTTISMDSLINNATTTSSSPAINWDFPILTRLVIFTGGIYNMLNAYDGNDASGQPVTFAEDNINVFKYTTPAITLLPWNVYQALDGNSATIANEFATPSSLK